MPWLLLLLALAPVASAADPAASSDSSAAAARASRRTGIADWPGVVWDDARHLVTARESYVILGLGLAAAGAAHAADDEIAASDFVARNRSERNALDHFFDAGDALGHGAVHISGAVLGYGLGKAISNREMEELGRDLMRAQILNGAMTLPLKVAVGRERPDGSSRRSFPSGHASTAFATATVLQGRYGWKAGAPSYLVASYVAASRMNAAKHYLSDVVFGATLGILAGRTATVEVRGQHFSLLPSMHHGTPGIELTWLAGSGNPVARADEPRAAGSTIQ